EHAHEQHGGGRAREGCADEQHARAGRRRCGRQAEAHDAASRTSSTGVADDTTGASAKLPCGGGDVVAHSSVWPCHGSSPAAGPRAKPRPAWARTPSTTSAITT